MEDYGFYFWLEILGGNLCYVLMLLSLGVALKKSAVRKVGYILLIACLLGFFILDPFFKEIKLPGIVSGAYSDLNKNIRFILGIICAIIPFAFIPCYQFLTFKMRLHQNKKKYKAYVYHDVFFLFSTGLWCMWLFGSFFFGSAMSGNYKLSWDWIFGVLLVIYYMGGICMALLRQATFVIMDGQYSYYNLKKTFEGELKDIGSVEMVKGGIILHIKEEELYIRCTQMPYADLLKDKLADFK